MSKSAKRIPSLRAGAKKVFRRRQRATTAHRATRSPAPLATVTQPAAAVPQTIYLQMVTFAMVIMCVVAIALSRRPVALAAADADHVGLEQLHQSDFTPVPTTVVPGGEPTAAAGTGAVASPAVAAPTATAVVLKSEKTRIADAISPTAAVAAIDEALDNEPSSTTIAGAQQVSADAPFVAPDPVAPGAVTVTGCLETNGNNGFRLSDTEGTDAPTSRSWRSGFLRKRSTSVALVAPPDTYTLRTQVGNRIAASGQLTGRELRVTSVQVIGARCE